MTNRFVCFLVCFACHSVLAEPRLSADVVPGQMDDFEDGSTSGWQHGMPNPEAPRVVADGGPSGSGDAFLMVSSNGGAFGAGSKLIMFNQHDHWTGSYLGGGLGEPIVALEMDLNNLGQEPLKMWFNLDGSYLDDEGDEVFATVATESFELAAGSGWQHASFSLLPEHLTSDGDILQVLSNVDQVWFFHNDTAAVHPAPSLEAILGMDNLTAVGMIIELPPGDYNGSGLVEQADLDLVLGNWGLDGTTPPTGWTHEPPDGFIDQAELDRVLSNWGRTSASLSGGSAIPEPAGLVLLVLSAAGLPWHLARSRSETAACTASCGRATRARPTPARAAGA